MTHSTANHRPIPPDWFPSITTERGRLVWRGMVTVIEDGHQTQVRLELGYPANRHGELRHAVWALHEHARLGNHGAIAHCRTDRHKGKRPIGKVQMTAEMIAQAQRMATMTPEEMAAEGLSA